MTCIAGVSGISDVEEDGRSFIEHWFARHVKVGDYSPCALIISASRNTCIECSTALFVTCSHRSLCNLERPIYGARKPVYVVDCPPHLLSGILPASFNFLKSSAHYSKLSIVDAQSTNSYGHQKAIKDQSQNFEKSKLKFRFCGWALLIGGYICEQLGLLSFVWFSWNWRKRVFWGTLGFIFGVWLIIHGFGIILQADYVSVLADQGHSDFQRVGNLVAHAVRVSQSLLWIL